VGPSDAVRAALSALFDRHSAEAALPPDPALRDAVLDAYAAPHRAYHGLSHLVFLFEEIARRQAAIGARDLVRFAAWMHDAVYEIGARNNEARSAAWARGALAARPDLAERVAHLILMTADHHAGVADPDEALFLDMDFAILGAPPAHYVCYAAAIRREFSAAPAEAYRNGRGAFLTGVLAQKRMFRTDLYEDERGDQARANLAWEIGELAAGRIPGA